MKKQDWNNVFGKYMGHHMKNPQIEHLLKYLRENYDLYEKEKKIKPLKTKK